MPYSDRAASSSTGTRCLKDGDLLFFCKRASGRSPSCGWPFVLMLRRRACRHAADRLALSTNAADRLEDERIRF